VFQLYIHSFIEAKTTPLLNLNGSLIIPTGASTVFTDLSPYLVQRAILNGHRTKPTVRIMAAQPTTALSTPAWHYKPPDGGIYTANPRTVTDILLRTALIHLFALCAFVLHASFRQPLRPPTSRPWCWPWQSGGGAAYLEAVAAVLFPELVLIQLATNALQLVAHVHRHGFACAGLGAYAAMLLGGRALDLGRGSGAVRVADVDPARLVCVALPRRRAWGLGVGFAVLDALPLALAVAGYWQRLRQRYRSARYVANLGIDHANGWAAIGGLVCVALALAALALNRAYVLQQGLPAGVGRMVAGGDAEARPGTAGGAGGQAGTGTRAALDGDGAVFAALRAHAPGGGGGAAIERVLLWQMVAAALVHQIPLGATNHASVVAQPITRTLRAQGAVAAAYLLFARWRAPRAGWAARLVGLVVLAAGWQMWEDGWELWDAWHYRVQPYNYRWVVKDWGSNGGGFGW
jgi:hypothetical protein